MDNLNKIYLSPTQIEGMLSQIKRLDDKAIKIKLLKTLEVISGDEFWEAFCDREIKRIKENEVQNTF